MLRIYIHIKSKSYSPIVYALKITVHDFGSEVCIPIVWQEMEIIQLFWRVIFHWSRVLIAF